MCHFLIELGAIHKQNLETNEDDKDHENKDIQNYTGKCQHFAVDNVGMFIGADALL